MPEPVPTGPAPGGEMAGAGEGGAGRGTGDALWDDWDTPRPCCTDPLVGVLLI